jgi:hypothetical protein
MDMQARNKALNQDLAGELQAIVQYLACSALPDRELVKESR